MRITMALLSIPLLVVAGTSTSTAAGCSPSACTPRTGDYGGPNPQGLKTSFGSTATRITVEYRKGGKKRKSKYGNTISYAAVYLRYTCPTPNNPWVETGATPGGPVKIGSDGKARVVVKPFGYAGTHTWTFKFTRDKVTGRVAGTYTNSAGETCKAAVDFRATLKP